MFLKSENNVKYVFSNTGAACVLTFVAKLLNLRYVKYSWNKTVEKCFGKTKCAKQLDTINLQFCHGDSLSLRLPLFAQLISFHRLLFIQPNDNSPTER